MPRGRRGLTRCGSRGPASVMRPIARVTCRKAGLSYVERAPVPPDLVSPDASVPPPESHEELRAATADALRSAVLSNRRAWNEVERIVRGYIRELRIRGVRSERAVAEAKALVAQATGDPLSSLVSSVVTWTLSEYYER